MAEPSAEADGQRIRCPACGAKVRIPAELPLPKARCPRCRSHLDDRIEEGLPEQLGPWRIRRRIASGGMGTVYAAEHRDGRQVALKVLQTEAEIDENILQRFAREARIGQHLDHPGLARVLESGTEAGRRWLVMELVDGLSLSRQVKKSGPLGASAVLALLPRLTAALRYLHGLGIIHRDLKPGNVILAADGPRLIDLGLAKTLDRTLDATDCPPLTFAGDQLGTPSYMAPEQVDDSLNVTSSADIYGLGATAYYALSGKAPYDGGSSVEVLEKVVTEPAPPLRLAAPTAPAGLVELVAWCMARQPTERPDLDRIDQAVAALATDPNAVKAVRSLRHGKWSWLLPWAKSS